MSRHVVVIGGGITGLAAVERLTREQGHLRVTLLERTGRFGGHIRTERHEGFTMEAGPDVLLAAKPAAIELARRVGLGDRLVGTSPTARGSYIWTPRRLVRLPEGMTGLVPSQIKPFITTPLLSPSSKLRVALEYFIPPRREESDESVRSFIVRRLGHEMYERLAEPLLSGISAGDGGRLSMATMFSQLRALEREHGGLLRAMLAARRTRSGSRSSGASSAFISFPNGLGELTEAVVRTIRDRDSEVARIALRTDASAAAIQRDADAGFAIELSSGGWLAADAVILATPAYVTSCLVQTLSADLSARLAAIDYESTVTISLAFPDGAIARQLDGTGYVIPRYLGRSAVACTWASAKFEGRAPNGYALFRLFFGGANRGEIAHAADSVIRQLALDELAEVMGIRVKPLFCRINRFERAMPQYHVGHLDRVGEIESLAGRIPGLHLAGAAYGGVGIPDCVRSGERAAAAAIASLTAMKRAAPEHGQLLNASQL